MQHTKDAERNQKSAQIEPTNFEMRYTDCAREEHENTKANKKRGKFKRPGDGGVGWALVY